MAYQYVSRMDKNSQDVLNKGISIGHVVSRLDNILSATGYDFERIYTPLKTSQALAESVFEMCQRNETSTWTELFKDKLSTEEDLRFSMFSEYFNKKLSSDGKVAKASFIKILNLPDVKQILSGLVCKLYGAKKGRVASVNQLLDIFGQDIVDGYTRQRRADPYAYNLTTIKADQMETDDMFLDVMTNQEGKHCYPAPIQNVTMNDISIRMAWLSSAEQLEFLSGYKECLEGADDRLMKTRQTITSILDTVRSALDRTESRLVWKATVAPLAHTICQTDMETSTLRAKLCKIFDAAKSKPLNKFFNDLPPTAATLPTTAATLPTTAATLPTTAATLPTTAATLPTTAATLPTTAATLPTTAATLPTTAATLPTTAATLPTTAATLPTTAATLPTTAATLPTTAATLPTTAATLPTTAATLPTTAATLPTTAATLPTTAATLPTTAATLPTTAATLPTTAATLPTTAATLPTTAATLPTTAATLPTTAATLPTTAATLPTTAATPPTTAATPPTATATPTNGGDTDPTLLKEGQTKDETSHLPLSICTSEPTVAQLEHRKQQLERELVRVIQDKLAVLEEQQGLAMPKTIQTPSTDYANDNNMTTTTQMATTKFRMSDDTNDNGNVSDGDNATTTTSRADGSINDNVVDGADASIKPADISSGVLEKARQSTVALDLEISDSEEEDNGDHEAQEGTSNFSSAAFLAEMTAEFSDSSSSARSSSESSSSSSSGSGSSSEEQEEEEGTLVDT
ncbi:Zonadhesin [Folsomia candida]|uniref:Zonadhesin n=1 Tax=Folsomia candida TaxID=158441 RepID=A0A226E9B8_FOLCA|nr:Zonadhesin [Folsomia candida]